MSQLVIDPIILAATINSGEPDLNYGTSVYLQVRYQGASTKSSAYAQRTWIEVDISAIPSGSTIASTSKLEKYCTGVDAAAAATLYRVTQTDVVELEVTWNSRKTGSAWVTPGGDYGDPHVHFTTPAAPGWFTITDAEFAAFLQDALNNRGGIGRMLLRIDTESAPTKGAAFSSDDDTHDPSWKLKLTVDYTEGGAAYVESYGCMF